MTKQELMDFFQVSESTIKTNFPKFAAKQAEKGFLISRRGKGESAIYEIEKIVPQKIDKDNFSIGTASTNYIKEDLPGEIWVDTYCSNDYAVSNKGRLKRKKDNLELKGTINKDGYVVVKNKDFNKGMHRLVYQSFYHVENFEENTVDHINGNKQDNSLENLRLLSNLENIQYMMMNRSELNKELSRLIVKYGSYEEVLKKLKEL